MSVIFSGSERRGASGGTARRRRGSRAISQAAIQSQALAGPLWEALTVPAAGNRSPENASDQAL